MLPIRAANSIAGKQDAAAASRKMLHDDAGEKTSHSRKNVMTETRGISRRRVLTIAAGATGASIASTVAVIAVSTPAQAAKVSQKIVKYQDTPKGEQRCENCVQFEAPSSCKTVDGTVAAQGWCMVYAKKQS
jgi:hypothetical protein